MDDNTVKLLSENPLKTIVRGAYDVQKLRIQMGNRIVANFKEKLGQHPGMSEEELAAAQQDVLSHLRERYKKITDGVKNFPTQGRFKGDGVISGYTELCLVAQYLELEKDEETHFNRLKYVLREYDIYNEFLKPCKGVGPAMAGVIISEIDIHKARYSSSLWKLAGLDVAPDGKGRSKRAEHLIDVEYETKDGEIKTKKSITFKPFLKTKLLGVLGPSFLKSRNERYRGYYDNYRHRLEHRKESIPNPTDGHLHNMALRYMVKMFLCDLYEHWRPLEGLEVHDPYAVAKLGLQKHG